MYKLPASKSAELAGVSRDTSYIESPMFRGGNDAVLSLQRLIATSAARASGDVSSPH